MIRTIVFQPSQRAFNIGDANVVSLKRRNDRIIIIPTVYNRASKKYWLFWHNVVRVISQKSFFIRITFYIEGAAQNKCQGLSFDYAFFSLRKIWGMGPFLARKLSHYLHWTPYFWVPPPDKNTTFNKCSLWYATWCILLRKHRQIPCFCGFCPKLFILKVNISASA